MACLEEKVKTRILKAGKVSKISGSFGFTLLELIVVLFIISIMFGFAAPEFSQRLFRDDVETTLNWIVFNAGKLKADAKNRNKDFYMCINSVENIISIKADSKENESFDEQIDKIGSSEREIKAELNVPENISIDRVEFRRSKEQTDDDLCIQFYKKGYSDHAIIHISDFDGNYYSCLIQPFISKVKVYEKNISFE